ncbi:MAG: hypothetical protein J6A63_08060 [Clostridia bacterium]|nr:hypothetical protein [Clostridia bacterium]
MAVNLEETASEETKPASAEQTPVEQTATKLDDKKTFNWKKIGKIAIDVIIYVFIAICMFGVIVTISSANSDGAANIFGHQMRLVQSPSMEKSEFTDTSAYDIKDIPTLSVVFIQTVPENETERTKWYDSLKEGDVLTFKFTYTKQETITHRLTKKTPIEGGWLLELEGDNKTSQDGALTQIINTTLKNSTNYVIGKVVGVNYPMGLFIYALKQPVGLIFIVIVPCLVIIAFEVFKILSVLNEDKKAKALIAQQQQQEEIDKQQSEIEELKRQLAAMQNLNLKQTVSEETKLDPTENSPVAEETKPDNV